MKYIKSALLSLGILTLGIFATSCKEDSVVSKIVVKTYSVTTMIENYVRNTDATNLVTKLKNLEGPLNVTKSSISYLITKIENEAIKANLSKINDVVATLLLSVDLTTPDQINEFKITFLNRLADVKQVMEQVAQTLKIDLEIKAIRGLSEDIILKEVEELNALLKKVEKSS